MATIRLLESVAGVDTSYNRGDVVEMPDDQAAAWVAGDRAELVEDTTKTEKAASKSRGGGRGARVETRDA